MNADYKARIGAIFVLLGVFVAIESAISGNAMLVSAGIGLGFVLFVTGMTILYVVRRYQP